MSFSLIYLIFSGYSKYSMSQKQYKPHYEHLKNKWTEQNEYLEKSLWEKHREALEWLQKASKHFIVGSVAAITMVAQPVNAASITPMVVPTPKQAENKIDTKANLIEDLSYVLPKKVRELTEDEEKVIAQTLSRHFNITIKASLNGIRLNRTYGLIGAEQHLMRYPGDMMDTHFETNEQAKQFYASGMAPGKGAWGYFVSSQEAMTKQDVDREQWYIAVQTFLAPGFNTHTLEYYQFFKFRKMLVVNPENGKAVIAVIGDAGPSPWTGKQLGGSPEVMQYLDRQDGAARGPVLYFFIDDQNDTLPLGPVEVKQ
jgi:hypothetical protein